MNKCEHGERIFTFCASESCSWKEPGGCQMCMRKYHNHMGASIFITEDTVQTLVKKYQLDHNIKPKCRLLQEAIYNYFNLIKNQISNSIDLVCKNIINQIGYPFLFANNALSSYKRLKNKEYKKISQNQFRLFYDISLKINDKDLSKDEARIYLAQIKQTVEILNSLEALMKNYQNIAKSVNYTFDHDSAFIRKIHDIVKSINIDSPGRAQTKAKQNQSKQSTPKDLSEIKNQFKIDFKTQLKPTQKYDSPRPDLSKNIEKPKETIQPFKQLHSRDVSLDKKIVKQHKLGQKKQNLIDNSGKIENLKLQLNQKQLQINEKKRQLMDMMKQKDDSPRKRSNDKQKRRISLARPSNPLQISPVLTPKKNQIQLDSSINDDKYSAGDLQLQATKNTESINKNYAFTKLPLQENQSKRFQERGQVKKKLIVIPALTNFKDNSSKVNQIDSPLYKKKDFINKHNQFRNKQQKQDPITFVQPKSNSNKKDDILQLKENQQKSLAVLLKSLSLKAQEAIIYLESALKLADNNLSAAEYLSFLYIQINRPRDCLSLCNRMLDRLELTPDNQQLCLILSNNKAAALNILGRYSQSIVILQKCLKYKEKDTLLKNLGDAYFSIGIYQKAILSYEKAVKLNQTSDETHYNMAVCLYTQENYHNAKISVRKAIQLHPKQQAYHELLVNIESKICS